MCGFYYHKNILDAFRECAIIWELQHQYCSLYRFDTFTAKDCFWRTWSNHENRNGISGSQGGGLYWDPLKLGPAESSWYPDERYCSFWLWMHVTRRHNVITLPPGGMRSTILWLSMNVCLSASISQKPQGQPSNVYPRWLWPVSTARSSTDDVVRCVLLFLWMTSCFHTVDMARYVYIPKRRKDTVTGEATASLPTKF